MYYTISFVLLILVIHQNQAQNAKVTVENGLIEGKTLSFDGNHVNAFLGIPYAEPPVGDLRFKKPVPKGKWTQTLKVQNWSNACQQSDLAVESFQNKNRSEDCLYLNIYSPKDSKSGLKAVMFWLHGGAFILGSAVQSSYDPLVLSTKGDVVVVTINYRLGPFGLFYSGTDEGPGNVALWDQILALKWVHNNIKNFGGDPNRVTIFGESAGSMSVSFLILSQLTRNLFQNAIMMSGSALFRQMVTDPQNALNFWVNASKHIGCNDEQNTSSDKMSPKIMNCLKNASVDQLLSIPFKPLDNKTPFFIKDGHIIPDFPKNMMEKGDHKKTLNLMIGDDEDEGSNLLFMFRDENKFNLKNPKNFTFNEAVNELKQIIAYFDSSKQIDGQNVAKLYFTGQSDKTDRDLLRQTIGIAYGDYLLTCPTMEFGKRLFRNDNKSNVYQYYYNSKLPPDVNPVCSQWMGVCHGSDLLPVFGLPFGSLKGLFSDRDRLISQQMMESFTSFAKTGKPSINESPEWYPFYSAGSNTISPYIEFVNSNTTLEYKNGLKLNECDYIFSKYI